MQKFICGIQQVGVGIPNVYEAWKWYRENFGMDIPVFDDPGEAAIMLPYTGGKPRQRHAVLALNIHGGSGFEIWQYTSRTPEKASFEIQLGDLGIFAAKIKCTNVSKAFGFFNDKNSILSGEVSKTPDNKEYFFIKDPYDNIFQLVKDDYWFKPNKGLTGGPLGVIIGVSDMEKSILFYKNILGYDSVVYDKEGQFDDFKSLSGGDKIFRRVLLTHSKPRKGAFSRLLGPSAIELVRVLDREPRKIFENRLWGDLGFIHLCFDIVGMNAFREDCKALGHPFTVDSSNSFDMGEAAGHFSYIEDPDGALIEFVETYKIPIVKKIGWYLNLQNRNREKPLPNWILKALSLNRVKD